MLIVMGLKYSIHFTVAFSRSLYFYSQNKCHNLPGTSEKVHITAKFQKTEFDKYATGGVSALGITSVYLIQVIMKQNCPNSCYKQRTRLKTGY